MSRGAAPHEVRYLLRGSPRAPGSRAENGGEAPAGAQTTARQAQIAMALRQLLSGVVHDLNNPLGVILGYVDLLDAQASPEDLREFGDRIRGASERCLEVLECLREWGHSEGEDLDEAPLPSVGREVEVVAAKFLARSSLQLRMELSREVFVSGHGRADLRDLLLLRILALSRRAPRWATVYVLAERCDGVLVLASGVEELEGREPGSRVLREEDVASPDLDRVLRDLQRTLGAEPAEEGRLMGDREVLLLPLSVEGAEDLVQEPHSMLVACASPRLLGKIHEGLRDAGVRDLRSYGSVPELMTRLRELEASDVCLIVDADLPGGGLEALLRGLEAEALPRPGLLVICDSETPLPEEEDLTQIAPGEVAAFLRGVLAPCQKGT